MADFENVFIYVSDSLRYDHVPESIASERNVIPTLIPAGYSPISFASLATGLDSRNHNVRSFYDTLEKKTAFEKFENHCFYDHPNDALVKNTFRDYQHNEELGEIGTPFFYIERAMDTHYPYGEIGHGNRIPEDLDESGSRKERYPKGVESTEEHFWQHVEELKERGLYEDTLIIFTSDHGEMLGERYIGKNWHSHNKPLKRELCVVPTVFLNHDIGADRARTIDLVPTALSLTGREPIGDGLDLTSEKPDTGHTMLQIQTKPLLTTGCQWEWKQGWTRGRGGLKTDIVSLGLEYIEPMRQRLRHTKIADLFDSDVSKQRDFGPEDDNIEELDV